ncbi:Ribokinase-like protein [Pluteus cervinus]|uniref:Ribokinase-like protein n=1 Tax=Pluteus cervinus TaxID=181527 RepID=A0ACD3AEN0_9AGAR|nr:Ribokinase-like protein [Pluteus cervinus]
MPVPRPVLEQIKQLIPPLNGKLHKGQSGRVGVLGGALDYTGAPYFAAMSALRVGADLSHVICSPTASDAIKSYSPDLIVHPILIENAPKDQVQSQLQSLFSRLHVLVIGPGLGREPYMQAFAKLALGVARSNGMFIVLDADAIWLVGKDLSLIKGYRRAVVTPNVVEFKRFSEQVGVGSDVPPDQRAEMVSRKLGGVTVLEKGASDIIAVDTTGEEASLSESKLDDVDVQKEAVKEVQAVDVEGGLKRCGGQGDILSGLVGTFLAWGKCYETGAYGDNSVATSRMPLLAAIGGSMVTRTASRRAFAKEGRSVVTQDMIPEIGRAFGEVFGDDFQGQGKL